MIAVAKINSFITNPTNMAAIWTLLINFVS